MSQEILLSFISSRRNPASNQIFIAVLSYSWSKWVTARLPSMHLDSEPHHDFLIDIISALKVHVHTRNPGRPSRAVLCPSSKRTLGFSPVAWFMSIVLLFRTPFSHRATPYSVYHGLTFIRFHKLRSPLPTITLLISASKILGNSFLNIFISLLRISPLGATALIGYFMLVIVLWCMFLPHLAFIHYLISEYLAMILFPRLLPFHPVVEGL